MFSFFCRLINIWENNLNYKKLRSIDFTLRSPPNFPWYYLQWYILITYTYHSQLLVSVFSQPIILNSPVPVNLDRKSIKAVVQRVYPWILVSGGVATIIIITRQLSYPPLRRLCAPVGRLAACSYVRTYVRGEGVEEMNVWTLAYCTGCPRFRPNWYIPRVKWVWVKMLWTTRCDYYIVTKFIIAYLIFLPPLILQFYLGIFLFRRRHMFFQFLT